MHISSNGDVGLYENSHSNWIIVQKADGSVDIPHTTRILGDYTVTAKESCIMMSPSQFISTYGGTLPSSYGVVIIYGYSRPNNFQGDTYYLIVDSATRVYNGHQLNGATTITWQKQMGASDFSYSNGTLTITTT